MSPFRPCWIVSFAVALGLCLSCGRATGVPSGDSAVTTDSQAAPFDRESDPKVSRSPGSLPSLLGKLPVGTPLTIRLVTPVSSASSRTGDAFEGRLDDPAVIEGREAVPRGATVTGRILAAKPEGLHDPGYLRIALVALNIDGKRVPIETSSLFAKGGAHGIRKPSPTTGFVTGQNDVSFPPERRLTFRLARTVELQ